MDINEFFDRLIKYKLLSPIRIPMLELVSNELNDNKKDILYVLSIYFSFIDKGNICIKLDKDSLLDSWNKRINETKASLLENDENINLNELDELVNNISNNIENGIKILLTNSTEICGEKKLFIIEDNYLYNRIFYNARKIIINKINELYNFKFSSNVTLLDISKITLSKGQQDVINKGLTNNLLVTGGPGTGKTTSILFLLIHLLLENPDYNVYITAPSGKAASRMQESINLNIEKNLKENIKDSYKDIIDKIKSLEGLTIHRLLGYNNDGFQYNKDNQFDVDSIFIIDEASMIDVVLFSELLSAIPSGARIFILGDKNQLPSVGEGAVFGELLNLNELNNNVVEIDESQRFNKNTDIYNVLSLINKGYEIKNITWLDANDFKIEDDNAIKPIYCYQDSNDNKENRIFISKIINKWYEKFLEKAINDCKDIEVNADFDAIYNNINIAKILCAENQSLRGVYRINNLIINKCHENKDIYIQNNNYAGEFLSINKNDYQLDLFNGDSGIAVKFKDDETLYFMIQKSSNIIPEGKRDSKIFKLGNYLFYPLFLISKEIINTAYAITIHKSQGSDYNNILVILPKNKEHPLLNRQILYTALSRTKGNTYVLSNNENFNKAINTLENRETNIKKL